MGLEYKNKKVIVTGGGGYIGTRLCRRLKEAGAEVSAYSLKFNEKIEGVNYIEEDITKENCFDDANIDLIFHLAAQPSVYVSQKDPLGDFKTNALGTLNVLEFARKNNIKVVFTSSIALYPHKKNLMPLQEDKINPDNFYGLSKKTAEEYIRFYWKFFKVRSVILRFSYVYGPGITRGPIFDIFSQLREGKTTIRLFSNEHNVLDFIFIDDVIDGLMIAGADPRADNNTINMGNGIGYSLGEIGKIAGGMFNKSNVNFVDADGKEFIRDDTISLILDNSFAQKILGWKPKVSMDKGLGEVFKSFQ